MIWKILTTGTPYEDMICLNENNMDKLIMYFCKNNNDLIKKYNEKG